MILDQTINAGQLYFAFGMAIVCIAGLIIIFKKDIHNAVKAYIEQTQKMQVKGMGSLEDMQLPSASFHKEWRTEHDVLGIVNFTCNAKTQKEALEGIVYLLNLSNAHDHNQLNRTTIEEKDRSIG